MATGSRGSSPPPVGTADPPPSRSPSVRTGTTPRHAHSRKDGHEPGESPGSGSSNSNNVSERPGGGVGLRLPGRRRTGEAPHRGRRRDHRPSRHRRESGAHRPRPVGARAPRRLGIDAVRHRARAPRRWRGTDRRRHRGRRRAPGRPRHRAPRRAGPNARPPQGRKGYGERGVAVTLALSRQGSE